MEHATTARSGSSGAGDGSRAFSGAADFRARRPGHVDVPLHEGEGETARVRDTISGRLPAQILCSDHGRPLVGVPNGSEPLVSLLKFTAISNVGSGSAASGGHAGSPTAPHPVVTPARY